MKTIFLIFMNEKHHHMNENKATLKFWKPEVIFP
jgi:hypothetical protein